MPVFIPYGLPASFSLKFVMKEQHGYNFWVLQTCEFAATCFSIKDPTGKADCYTIKTWTWKDLGNSLDTEIKPDLHICRNLYLDWKHLLGVLSPCIPTAFTRVFLGRLKSSHGLAIWIYLCPCKCWRNMAWVTDRCITEQKVPGWLSGAWIWPKTSPQWNMLVLTEGSDHIVPPGFVLFLMVFTGP